MISRSIGFLLALLLCLGCNLEPNHQKTTLSKSETNSIKTEAIKQGVFVKYFPNGDLYIIETYKNNKLNGPVVGFFDNKKVNISGYYKEGKREGAWLFFTQEGKLRKKVMFDNDKAGKTWQCDDYPTE